MFFLRYVTIVRHSLTKHLGQNILEQKQHSFFSPEVKRN